MMLEIGGRNGGPRREARLQEIDRRLLSVRLYKVGVACVGLPTSALMVVLLLPIVRLAESMLHPPIVGPVLLAVTLALLSMLGYQLLGAMAVELSHERESLSRQRAAVAREDRTLTP
jgi:hypothetical protein